ncbi:MAG: exonuclease domain-containing protein [Bacteroidales bacterium]|nr:exonuclease domain-containing protein [Bacteroidales bacterium]MDD3665233.1 exonuclease domain-containing protein [Bacteroidales bacterium]
MSNKYCIIDVETTGTSARDGRITEVAIYCHDGEKITDEFSTLVNPEQRIPYRITQLTGITDRMVADAPRFCEVARRIVEMTEGAVFVAHNAAFDYSFIREEFARLGYDYHRERLCTVRLSRKLLPGKPSYSLGNLCQSLGIEIEHRHRAAGDALATVKLFELLLSIENHPESVALKGISTGFDTGKLKNLPQETGVYYLHNSAGAVIYVGKSLNIRDRVVQHLTNITTRKALEMSQQIADITWELTGSELVALLLESYEIKQLLPVYNRAQRRNTFSFGLFDKLDSNGYLNLEIKRIKEGDQPLTSFASKTSGQNQLFLMVENHQLCQKLCGLYKTKGACFHYGLKQCRGACVGEETPSDYNQRVEEALRPYQFTDDSFLVVDKGRTPEERSAVLVRHGCYRGFGYVDVSEEGTIESLEAAIRSYPDNRDARQIIRQHLRLHKVEKVVKLV